MAQSEMETFIQRAKAMFDEAQTKQEVGAVEYKGRKFFSLSTECLKRMENWEMPQNSIVIASFPKTGTAWTTEVVRNILFGNDEAALAKSRSIPVPMLLLELGSQMKFDFYDKLPMERKFFCTHVPAELFDFEMLKKTNGKMIYVYRNPKDQAVSWFHFSKMLPFSKEFRKELGETWDEFYANYVNGRHPHGLLDGEWYPDHILGWLKHKNDEHFLMVEYESMKKDFPKEIGRIAEFLGVDVTDSDVERIIQKCSIGSMKKAGEKEAFFKMNVRKGQVGGWKDTFTVAQSELMDKCIEEKMAGSGIDFTYVL